MLFRRHRNRPGGMRPKHTDLGGSMDDSEFIRIEFDMMKKGSVFQRRGRPVRQFGVTVSGSTRLVTSGDVVDRKTYEALVAAGAIAAVPEYADPSDRRPIGLPDEGVTGAHPIIEE